MLGAAIGLDLYLRYLPAVRALEDGRASVLAAEALVRDDLGHMDQARLDRAAALLQRAREDFGPRSAVLDDGLIVGLLDRLPWAGDQVDAARALRKAGQAGITLGLDVVPVAKQLLPSDDPAGEPSLTRVARIVDSQRAVIHQLQADLEALRTASEAIPRTTRLLGPLDRARSTIEQEAPRVQSGLDPALRLLGVLPKAIGPGTHTYLLVMSNPGEERPGGG